MFPARHADVLLVSSLPPSRCGIASYAGEHLRKLLQDGHSVHTASPLADSDASLHLDLKSVSGCLSAWRAVRRISCQQVIVHYTDSHFFPWRVSVAAFRPLCRILQSQVLRTLAQRSRHSQLIIHEAATDKRLAGSFTWLRQRAFAACQEISFHTDAMRREFLSLYQGLAAHKTTLIDHARYMSPRFAGSRNEARASLGLPADGRILLCLGFIQESKGFHDAVHALASARPPETILHIVGSLRGGSPDALAYAESLRQLCAATPGVQLHEQYLEDQAFDTWLAAADILILPYLGVASSGVGARASLYGTSLMVRDLPNLTEQFPDAAVFTTVENLAGKLQTHHQQS